ncbi:MAG: hypothetical protein ACRELC_03025, partial [Gemmatimonadota bacterium]
MPTSPVARLAVALAGFALVVPIPAAAQEAAPAAERLRVGSETIDPSGLTEGTRRYRLILVRGEQQQEIGTAATEVSFVQVGDRAAVRKVQIIQSDMIGGQADTAHAARDDLAALRVRSASANGTVSLDFDEARVTGRVATTGAEPRSIEQTLEERPFAVQTLDLIVRSLPLEEGAAWEVPVYTADSGELTSTRLTVVG